MTPLTTARAISRPTVDRRVIDRCAIDRSIVMAMAAGGNQRRDRTEDADDRDTEDRNRDEDLDECEPIGPRVTAIAT